MRTRKYSLSFISFIFLFHIILVSAASAANKIMPLGDSITKGIAGSTDDTGYRRSLYFTLIGNGFTVDYVGSQSDGIPVDFDRDHEGHGGWTADEIVNGNPMEPTEDSLAVWLADHEPNIILLHIGTNGLTSSAVDVEAILDEIDTFEIANTVTIWVVLARIINRECSTNIPPCSQSVTTMDFNDNVEDMALDRVNNPANLAFPDKIVIVDMEAGAGIDYRMEPVGEMFDNLHPNDIGYAKIANLWFSGLELILPIADAGPDQNVDEFQTVTLNGAGSTDPKSGNFSYQWVQTAGTPIVVLSDDTAPQPTFDAPDVGPAGETLTFTLTVTDDDELVSTDSVAITVHNPTPAPSGGGGEGEVAVL